MINVVAVDDEQGALDVLVDYIKDTPFLNLVAATTNSMEVVGILNSNEVDLVMTDIMMPRMNGLNLVSLFEVILNTLCRVSTMAFWIIW
jgi:YesN/AraC family two-component response regulator